MGPTHLIVLFSPFFQTRSAYMRVVHQTGALVRKSSWLVKRACNVTLFLYACAFNIVIFVGKMSPRLKTQSRYCHGGPRAWCVGQGDHLIRPFIVF